MNEKQNDGDKVDPVAEHHSLRPSPKASRPRRNRRVWNRIFWLTLPVCLLFGIYVFALRNLPTPVTLSTITALAERVEFLVTDRRLATIPITGMRSTIESADKDGACLTGTFVPDIGAVIAYERPVVGEVVISLVSGSASLPAHERRLTGPLDLIADEKCSKRADPEVACKTTPQHPACSPIRLPIWGRVRLGQEPRPVSASGQSSGLLLEGQLKVQARSLTQLWGIKIGDSGVYPISDMSLPVGARIEAADFEDRASFWWGTAYIDPQKVALQVQLATEATGLRVFRPGPERPDIITVSGFTQAIADPNIVRLQIALLGLLAILQVITSILPLVYEK
ncbi:hypothetical protein QO058_30185 (plasmid) [Bosea vestrisii]|uniref:hypothetical protein n=1 Tax=Bosea vestrisii TaxID=151416 RepID=UPI0024E0246F|nr:hypothetical protein [Bosea vestrisii]WID99672.1 hypothetical protein QO058_30185 [Bosea vestrisii]